MSHDPRTNQRKRVAREAAELLYTGQEKEYKQAKLHAAKTIGFHVLPNNAEIAEELDHIAQEREGKERLERLVQMRQEALQTMQLLEKFSPRLVGSIWRGTLHHHSDIDIVAYSKNPQKIETILHEKNYAITRAETQTLTQKGSRTQYYHIYLKLPSNNKVEIVVRSPNEIDSRVRCEIYGDIIRGLTSQQLQKILAENPLQKFTPE